MLSKTVRFVNLVLAGSLAGNEFGTWAAVHPSLEKLSPPERIRAEQEMQSNPSRHREGGPRTSGGAGQGESSISKGND